MDEATARPWNALRAAARVWPYRGVHHDKGFRWEEWNDETIAVVIDSLADKGLIVTAVNAYDRLRAIEAAALDYHRLVMSEAHEVQQLESWAVLSDLLSEVLSDAR